MTDFDDECKHGMATGTCSICNAPSASKRSSATRGGGISRSLDSPASLERYRDRYPGDRESTFEAYVEVFFRMEGARAFPGGWTMFSRCGNAEPDLAKNQPDLVSRAEELMRLAGYEADDSGRPSRGRRWLKVG